jgi:hypothetical protein
MKKKLRKHSSIVDRIMSGQHFLSVRPKTKSALNIARIKVVVVSLQIGILFYFVVVHNHASILLAQNLRLP